MESQPVATNVQEGNKGGVGVAAGQACLGLLGIAASILLIVSGAGMAGIESVGGRTLEEAFYHEMAYACYGLACFVGPLLWALAAMLGRMTAK